MSLPTKKLPSSPFPVKAVRIQGFVMPAGKKELPKVPPNTEEVTISKEEANEKMVELLTKTQKRVSFTEEEKEFSIGVVKGCVGEDAAKEIMQEAQRKGKNEQVALTEAMDALRVADDISTTLDGEGSKNVVPTAPLFQPSTRRKDATRPFVIVDKTRFPFTEFDMEVDGVDADDYEFEPF